jgi:hypothetical protein
MTIPAVLGNQLADYDPVSPPDLSRQVELINSFDDAIAAAETGLEVAGGVLQFDSSSALSAGLSDGDVYYVQKFVDKLNERVEGGFLSFAAGSTGWQSISSNSEAFWAGTAADVNINGRDYEITIENRWYGTVITLNKAATEMLVKLLNTGAAAGAVAAAVTSLLGVTAPVATVLALVSALLWLGAAVVDLCDFCSGVEIVIPSFGPPFVVPA